MTGRRSYIVRMKKGAGRFVTRAFAVLLAAAALRIRAQEGAAADRLNHARNLLAEVERRYRAGDPAGGIPLLEELTRVDPAHPDHHYNLACLRSLTGNPEAGLNALRRAVELGWSDFRKMERDPDLAAIRALPAFGEIRALNEPAQRARAARLEAQLREYFGGDFRFERDDDLRLLFAAKLDAAVVEATRDHLREFQRALRRELFAHGFEQYVAVVIPDPERPIPGPQGGFYNPVTRVLVARGVGRELNHEFTHAVHLSDMDARGQTHSPWIVEGLAVFFESGRVENGRWIPEHSHRLNEMQRALREGRALPFHELPRLNFDDLRGAAAVAYPQVGAIMRFLYDRGLLRRWYDIYTARYADDPTGLAALGAVLGKNPAGVEAEWKAWVLAQTPVAEEVGERTPYLGLQAERTPDGLRIKLLAPDSPLAAAGLAPGDVLEKFDGRRITESGQLLRAVSARAVGDTVEVEYRRNGVRRAVRVTLASRPRAE